MSQDPVFLALGDEAWLVNLTGDKTILMQLLSDPQQQNSYSYARNNPLIYTDPDGNLSTLTLLLHPISSVRHVTFWTIFALGFKHSGYTLAGNLLNHSITRDPKNVTITASNQKSFGNPIDKIKASSEYKAFMNTAIESAKQGKMDVKGNINFEQDKDLYYALHGVNIEVNFRQENDSLVADVTVSDRYNFDPVNPQTYKGNLTRLPAEQAHDDQQKGYISNYDVNINFTQTVK